MPPHGPGMLGGTHSHNPEFPDDTWNLYCMLSTETTALNVTVPSDSVGIFKPFERRLDAVPQIISDSDSEIIVIARFISPVHIRKMMIIGGENPSTHPSHVKCYVNKDDIDFSNISTIKPVQEFRLENNASGTRELVTLLQPFTNVRTLALYFPSNSGGGDVTSIRYIGLQGEHTHYTRLPVNALYEVVCSGQDSEITDHISNNPTHHLH